MATALRMTLAISATLCLTPHRSAWAVPPPTLDQSPNAPVEGPRRPPEPEPEPEPKPEPEPEPDNPSDAPAPPAAPAPTIDPEPPSGIELALPPPPPAGPDQEQSPDPLSGRGGSVAELRDPGRAPKSGNWLLVSGGYALPLAALGCSYYVWSLRSGAPAGANTKPQVVSIGVATGGIALYGALALSVGGYRNHKLARWSRRHRVVALPQGDGLLMGGSVALFSPIPFIPLGLSLMSVSSPLGVTMLVTTVGAAAIGSPIMFTVGARRLRRYRETGGWRRRTPSFVRRATPVVLPSPTGVTLGVAGQF
ncbi:hypothetical protein [Enhygromyxa salina]|uniref:hypothetical protein n=1 Tax=Enhygromyxa salina TaxID=215803 RepID=UPI0015E5BACB|nr:hypothetical protein [Enhygromyxa salina]